MAEIKYEDIKKANESIKTTDIKGKDYAEVNQRIKAFRMLFPLGFIKTEIISLENGVCTMKAVVGYYREDDYQTEMILAYGYAQEKESSSFINKTSYIENCETSAVGRALGMCGFGIDVSVASAEEVQNAIENQKPKKEQAKQEQPKKELPKQEAKSYDPNVYPNCEFITPEQKVLLLKEINRTKVDRNEVCGRYHVKTLDEIPREKFDKLIEILKGMESVG